MRHTSALVVDLVGALSEEAADCAGRYARLLTTPRRRPGRRRILSAARLAPTRLELALSDRAAPGARGTCLDKWQNRPKDPPRPEPPTIELPPGADRDLWTWDHLNPAIPDQSGSSPGSVPRPAGRGARGADASPRSRDRAPRPRPARPRRAASPACARRAGRSSPAPGGSRCRSGRQQLPGRHGARSAARFPRRCRSPRARPDPQLPGSQRRARSAPAWFRSAPRSGPRLPLRSPPRRTRGEHLIRRLALDPPPFRLAGEPVGKRHRRIRARSANRTSRRGGHRKARAPKPNVQEPGLPSLRSPRKPPSRSAHRRSRPGRQPPSWIFMLRRAGAPVPNLQATASGGGCCTNPRRGHWIASKGGLRNRPSHPSSDAGPSRRRRTQPL